MNRQDRYREEYRRLRPGWADSTALYADLILRHTSADTRILDIGCGHAPRLGAVYSTTPHTFGLEPDISALAKNTVAAAPVAGVAGAIPFRSDYFDVVVSAWVIEHLDRPLEAFREAHRVLKPGGKLIFLTPNAWNYNAWLIRAIPNRLHPLLVRRLYQRSESDTYPVRYRANSVRALERLLLPLGFSRSELILNGDPTYIAFNRPLFRLGCLIERALDWKPLNFARVHLIGVYEKR